MKNLKLKTELVQQGIMNHGVMDYDYTVTPWYKKNVLSGKELTITFCKHEYSDDQELIFKIFFDSRMDSGNFLDEIIKFIEPNNKYGNELAINFNYVLDHFANEYNNIIDDGVFTIEKSSYNGYKFLSIDKNGNIHYKCIMTGDEIYITPNQTVMRSYNSEGDYNYDEPRTVAIDNKEFILSKKDELNTFITSIKKAMKNEKH